MLTPEEFAVEIAGVREECRIEVESLLDFDDKSEDSRQTLYKVNSRARSEIADRMARNFHKEMHYDSRPYSTGDFGTPNRLLYLIRSHGFLRMIPVISGAVEIRIVNEAPILMWVWIHPFDRGCTNMWPLVWQELERLHGVLYLQAPLSHTMAAWADKVGVPADHRVTVN